MLAEWALLFNGAKYCGCTCWWCWPLAWLTARPCLVQKLLTTAGQGWVPMWLAAWPRGTWGWCQPTNRQGLGLESPGLVLACWWTVPVPVELVVGPRGAGPLVGARSWCGWLQMLGEPRTGARCWWVKL